MRWLERFRGRSGIVTALTVSFTVVIAISVVALTAWDVRQQRALLERQLNQRALLLSETMGYVLADSLYFPDFERLRGFAELITAQPEIMSVDILDSEGRYLVATTQGKYPLGKLSDEAVLSALAANQTYLRRGRGVLVVVSPVSVGHQLLGALRFELDTTAVDARIRQTIRGDLWMGFWVMLVCLVAAYLLARGLTRPILQLVAATQEVASGEFSPPVLTNRRDELGRLAASFHEMTESLQRSREREIERTAELRRVNEALRNEVVKRRQSQEEAEEANKRLTDALERLRETQETIVRDERLRAIGRLASGVAHNINNNLQVITGHCDILMGDSEGEVPNERIDEHLRKIRLAASDGAEIVRRLRQFYGPGDDRRLRAVNLNELLQEVITLAEPRWKDQAQAQRVVISVEKELEPVPEVLGEHSTLREAFVNLLFNAVDAIPERGTIRVATSSDGEQVTVGISDDGVGMSKEERDRCLEPFFSTKVVHGSGLGLPLVHGVVRDHGGALTIESEPGQGTTISIDLPVALEPTVEPAAAEEASRPRPSSILLVDDDPFVLEVLEMLLVRDGHQVVTVGDGSAALESCAARRFDLIITDMAMPGMSGDRLAGRLRQEGVTAPVILLTGFGDRIRTGDQQPPDVDLVVSKPISPSELRQAVMSVQEGAREGRPAVPVARDVRR